LVENIARNKRKNIKPINKAMSNQYGEREFYVNISGAHSFYSQGKRIKGQLITLKKLWSATILMKTKMKMQF
jgi:hypothetical protein